MVTLNTDPNSNPGATRSGIATIFLAVVFPPAAIVVSHIPISRAGRANRPVPAAWSVAIGLGYALTGVLLELIAWHYAMRLPIFNQGDFSLAN